MWALVKKFAPNIPPKPFKSVMAPTFRGYREKMERGGGGQNGTPGVQGKMCYVWVCCYVCVISVIGQCGLPQQDQTYIRSHFIYHTKMQFPHIRPFEYINSFIFQVRLLWQSKLQNHRKLLNKIINIFYIVSHPFTLAKGDSAIHMTDYIEMLYRG